MSLDSGQSNVARQHLPCPDCDSPYGDTHEDQCPRSHQSNYDDIIEIRCLWQRTDYGYISLKAAARGYGGRQLGSYQDGITDERFAQIRATEAEANPDWRLVESVVKVTAAKIEALFTDGSVTDAI